MCDPLYAASLTNVVRGLVFATLAAEPQRNVANACPPIGGAGGAEPCR